MVREFNAQNTPERSPFGLKPIGDLWQQAKPIRREQRVTIGNQPIRSIGREWIEPRHQLEVDTEHTVFTRRRPYAQNVFMNKIGYAQLFLGRDKVMRIRLDEKGPASIYDIVFGKTGKNRKPQLKIRKLGASEETTPSPLTPEKAAELTKILLIATELAHHLPPEHMDLYKALLNAHDKNSSEMAKMVEPKKK